MINVLKSSSRKHPFSIEAADSYVLKDGVGANMTDSHYFSGHASDGTSFFFRHAKRSDQTTEIWFCLKTSDGKVLCNKEELYPSSSCPADVRCTISGEEMSFSFNGQVAYAHRGDDDILFLEKNGLNIRARATFIASMPPFDFSTGLNPAFVAGALAEEKWNKTFWRNLKQNRQVHYEQPGIIKLEATIENQTYTYVLPAMRDHSYGYRDWNYMNRHIWLMVLFEDGEVLNLNMVDYPHMRNLMTGYISSTGNHTSLCSLTNLKKLGQDGIVPQQIEIEIPLMDNHVATLIGNRELVADFSFADGKYHICEGVGNYAIGEKKGRGILEFGYNRDTSRWK